LCTHYSTEHPKSLFLPHEKEQHPNKIVHTLAIPYPVCNGNREATVRGKGGEEKVNYAVFLQL